MNKQHQPLGLRTRVTEVGAKNAGDVGHKVDRVVPHNGLPQNRRAHLQLLIAVQLFQRRSHPCTLLTIPVYSLLSALRLRAKESCPIPRPLAVNRSRPRCYWWDGGRQRTTDVLRRTRAPARSVTTSPSVPAANTRRPGRLSTSSASTDSSSRTRERSEVTSSSRSSTRRMPSRLTPSPESSATSRSFVTSRTEYRREPPPVRVGETRPK